MTSWPGSNAEPSETSETTPAHSLPSVNGGSSLIWYWPWLSSRSGNETPAQWASISTIPARSSASGASCTISIPPGPDSSMTRAART